MNTSGDRHIAGSIHISAVEPPLDEQTGRQLTGMKHVFLEYVRFQTKNGAREGVAAVLSQASQPDFGSVLCSLCLADDNSQSVTQIFRSPFLSMASVLKKRRPSCLQVLEKKNFEIVPPIGAHLSSQLTCLFRSNVYLQGSRESGPPTCSSKSWS